TAMLANFLAFGLLLGISNQPARESESIGPIFRVPVGVLSAVLAGFALLLVPRAVSIEALHYQELLSKEALVYTQDGVKRPQRNPRLNLLAASIPRGNIYDRNGVLLATSSWAELDKHRADYEKLG